MNGTLGIILSHSKTVTKVDEHKTIKTMERDQLQTSYTNLTKERDQLQTSNTNLARERDELKRKLCGKFKIINT